jgi:hypothetical protein
MRNLLPKSLLAVLLVASHLHAQTFTSGPCEDHEAGESSGWFSGHQRVCELRRATLPLVGGQLSVSGKNGAIEVIGENRSDIALEARVVAQASTREEAESIARKIEIRTQGAIEAEGPSAFGFWQRNWSVSYRLRVPLHLAAHLHTENGSLKLSNVDGTITADTTNGSVALNRLAGSVQVRTVNGSLHVTLDGTEWRGAGLSARSTNGSVSVIAPGGYSAHLVAENVNGGMHVGFPITVQGGLGHRIDTNLGQGGATLQFETTNGGVHIDRN